MKRAIFDCRLRFHFHIFGKLWQMRGKIRISAPKRACTK